MPTDSRMSDDEALLARSRSAEPLGVRTAVYPGSFDPITKGHLEIIERSLRLFDRVIVAIGQHPTKKGYFPIDQRQQIIDACIAKYPRAESAFFKGLMVNFCLKVGARAIIRGLRPMGDFEPEYQMGLANRDIAPNIETVFLIPRPTQQFISSSLIREIAHHGGQFERYVPEPVAKAMRARLADK
ncbi:MAG: pantetheine-phosphate adenylyltransferase [Nannocystaceae bacterium]